MASFHSSSFRGTVSLTALASTPRNQQRSQLSVAYWTISRKGGDVTIKATELARILGVASHGPIRSRASGATLAMACRSAGPHSLSKDSDFLRMIPGTSRRDGTCWRRSLILRWDLTETAWFGGKV